MAVQRNSGTWKKLIPLTKQLVVRAKVVDLQKKIFIKEKAVFFCLGRSSLTRKNKVFPYFFAYAQICLFAFAQIKRMLIKRTSLKKYSCSSLDPIVCGYLSLNTFVYTLT